MKQDTHSSIIRPCGWLAHLAMITAWLFVAIQARSAEIDVTISNLSHVYNGSPKTPDVTVTPPGTQVDLVYRNTLNPPTPTSDQVFNNVPDTLALTYGSVSFAASQISGIGNYVTLGGNSRKLESCQVTLVTWAKADSYPSWQTANPLGYHHKVRLSLYHVTEQNQLIYLTEKEQLVFVPWRPLTLPNNDAYPYNGYAFNATFAFPNGITLPEKVMALVSYNTENTGFGPLGVPGPYNELNLAVSNGSPITVGGDAGANQVLKVDYTPAVSTGIWDYPNASLGASVPLIRLQALSTQTKVAPVDVGTYEVTGSVSDSRYTSNVLGDLTIAKASAVVQITNLSQDFDGNPHPVTVTTTPAGLPVTIQYAPGTVAPTAAGVYTVTATVNHANYQGTATAQLEVKPAIEVTLGNLSQSYTGGPITPSVTVNPPESQLDLVYRNISNPSTPTSNQVFNNIPDTLALTYGSVSFAASQISGIGNYVTLGGTSRKLEACQVTLVTWAKASSYPSWQTANPLGYHHNVRLTLYQVTDQNQLIYLTEKEESVFVPWRPETLPNNDPYPWNGYAFNATFAFPDGITLPKKVMAMVSYDTENTGFSPMGVPGPYNELNLAVSNGSPITVGSDAGANQVLKVDYNPLIPDGVWDYPNTSLGADIPLIRINALSTQTTIAPVDVGTYEVTGSVSDSRYTSTVLDELTIAKATALVQITNLSQFYDGSQRPVTVTTTPAGLPVTINYVPGTVAPTAVGVYNVTATVNHANYQGTATAQLEVEPAIDVTLGNLSQVYNGSPKTPSVTITPLGTQLDLVYRNISNPPTPTSDSVFNNVPDTLASTYGSVSFAASQISGIGNYVTLGGTSRKLEACQVTLVTWAKASSYPSWQTANPLGYYHRVRLSLYHVTEVNQLVYLTEAEQLVFVPWRPMTFPNGDPYTYNGYAFNATFAFPDGITLPEKVLAMVSYNTENTGFSPIGVPGPYNELNLAVSNGSTPITVGGDAGANQVLKVDYNPAVPTGIWDYPNPSLGASVPLIRIKALSTQTTIAPVDAGTYEVTGSVSDSSYTSTVLGDLTIAKATAVVQITNLNQFYDGNQRPVTVTTTPAGLPVITYYGATTVAPTALGVYNVQSIVNHVNYQGIATAQLQVTASYWSWINAKVVANQVPAGESGENDDPDKDGIPNLLEYSLNLDPAVPLVGGSGPQAVLPVFERKEGNWVMRYRRNLAATDVTYVIQHNRDLVAPTPWTSVTGTEQILSDDGFTRVVEVILPAPLQTDRNFYRLSVSR